MTGFERLRGHLVREYEKKTVRSRSIFRRAEKVMISGGSHTIRLWRPYPFFAAAAEGPSVRDVDGNMYIDYWQGHYANVLGHNPRQIRSRIAACLERGALHTGFEAGHQIELAEALVAGLGGRNAKVRFTTSGTLATMYAVMMAQGLTGRDHVLKVGGGWHGASPYLLKGVKYRAGEGFEGRESAGLLDEIVRRTLITRFNDCADLERVIAEHGDCIACFIVEPFLGVGGFLAASREYLESARRLTAKHGILLVFDEIISGFRFRPGGVQTLYGVRPDLTTLGKIIGGGHAVAAVVGPREIMEECEHGRSGGERVYFEGGTFSAHAEYVKAGLVMLGYLAGHAATVYPKIARSGERLRREIEGVFADAGLRARCTGDGNDVIRGSSMFMVHFPRSADIAYDRPEDIHDPGRSDLPLRENLLKLALLVNGVNVVHGGGAVSAAHGPREIDATIAAYADAARLFKKYLD
ncbi:MAG TPA: aminotransferase class III-fold pyridoxal phosphate-dependent enzyme [Acidobacteriota bacterium]|nr:aminotransferase class III-fold pyridoxal phosphate-dependent enzyme [Acidobacteriota bacterium]